MGSNDDPQTIGTNRRQLLQLSAAGLLGQGLLGGTASATQASKLVRRDEVPASSEQIWPSSTDVDLGACVPFESRPKPATGEGAATWVVWNGCGTLKDYQVTPGETHYIRANTDIYQLRDARFSLQEYQDGEWVEVARNEDSLSNGNDQVFEYTPSSDRIRIENVGEYGFYQTVFGPAEEVEYTFTVTDSAGNTVGSTTITDLYGIDQFGNRLQFFSIGDYASDGDNGIVDTIRYGDGEVIEDWSERDLSDYTISRQVGGRFELTSSPTESGTTALRMLTGRSTTYITSDKPLVELEDGVEISGEVRHQTDNSSSYAMQIGFGIGGYADGSRGISVCLVNPGSQRTAGVRCNTPNETARIEFTPELQEFYTITIGIQTTGGVGTEFEDRRAAKLELAGDIDQTSVSLDDQSTVETALDELQTAAENGGVGAAEATEAVERMLLGEGVTRPTLAGLGPNASQKTIEFVDDELSVPAEIDDYQTCVQVARSAVSILATLRLSESPAQQANRTLPRRLQGGIDTSGQYIDRAIERIADVILGSYEPVADPASDAATDAAAALEEILDAEGSDPGEAAAAELADELSAVEDDIGGELLAQFETETPNNVSAALDEKTEALADAEFSGSYDDVRTEIQQSLEAIVSDIEAASDEFDALDLDAAVAELSGEIGTVRATSGVLATNESVGRLAAAIATALCPITTDTTGVCTVGTLVTEHNRALDATVAPDGGDDR